MGTKRSTMVKAAAVAGAAGSAILAAATPAVADTQWASLTVSPSNYLHDGQAVDTNFATGLLYDPNGPFWPGTEPIYECTQPDYSADPAVCTQVGTTRARVLPAVNGLDPSKGEYFYQANTPLFHNPIKVKKSWSWVRGVPPIVQYGTTTCGSPRNCYMVAVGPTIGFLQTSASVPLTFGSPK